MHLALTCAGYYAGVGDRAEKGQVKALLWWSLYTSKQFHSVIMVMRDIGKGWLGMGCEVYFK